MKKLLIADDHKMVSEGFEMLLSGNLEFEVVKTAQSGQVVLDYLKFNDIDIAILDIDMPEPDGIETTRLIKATYPDIKVLIVSMFGSERKIQLAVDAGVDGYILKDSGKDEFLKAIKTVSEGETYFGQDVMSALLKARQSSSVHGNVALSKREKEVLGLIGKGKRSKDIADILNISSTTVDTHFRNIRNKLNITSRLELVVYAKDNGYV